MTPPTDPTRWPTIKRLFEEALDQPPPARAAYLDRACRTDDGAVDTALREAVDLLLAADARAEETAATVGGFLAGAPLSLGGLLDGLGVELAEPPVEAAPGTRVGPYRILRLLGRGGMGEVYLAERADGLFERTVALKRVRADLSPAVAARFSTERQILADLAHPGIARMYGAGADDDGRPWLAMEPVEGVPISEYAHEHRLGERERVGLVLQVCDAVHYAHQRLVIHRDLKPSNVLVTDEGRVELLDFGIAQILGGEAESRQMLTRAYASPEQLRGEPATTASDVYGLGMLLAETLTGRRPDPAASGLDGDLGAIARRALAETPGERYASAQALADDLRRWCEGLPVRALPSTIGYRARRFVGRHRIPVAAGVLATVLVLAAAGVTAVRVTAERDLAQQAAADAEAVAETQSQMLRILEPTFRATLDTTEAVSFTAVVEQVVADAEAAYADNPAVLARLLATLGTTLFERGEGDRADSLFARALALRQPLGRPGDAVVREGLLGRGLIARQRGDAATARDFFQQALALEQAFPEVVKDVTSSTGLFLASVLDDPVEREQALRQTLAERLAALPDTSIDLAQAHNALGVHLFNAGDYRGAFAEYSAAERIVRGQWGELHPATNTLRSNLAYASTEMGRTAEGERHARIALEAARRGELGAQREALLQQAIGHALFLQGRLAEAEREYRTSLATFERETGPASEPALMVLNSLVTVLAEQGRYPEALSTARRVEAAARAAGQLGETDGLYARNMVAAIRFALGERAVASEALDGVLRDLRTADVPPPMASVILRMVGDARRARGAAAGAVPLLTESLALVREARPDGHWNVLHVRLALGRALAARGRLDEARPHLEAARGRLRRVSLPAPLENVDAEIDRLLSRGD